MSPTERELVCRVIGNLEATIETCDDRYVESVLKRCADALEAMLTNETGCIITITGTSSCDPAGGEI